MPPPDRAGGLLFGRGAKRVIRARQLMLAVAAISVAASQALAGPAGGQAPAIALAGYHLGPGDKLRMITFGEDPTTGLSGEFFVSDAGDVSLPLVGNIRAEGL